MPSHMMSRRQRVPVYPLRKWFPDRGSAFVSALGYFIPQEFVRTYCGGSKKRLLVRSFLVSKTGCVCHFTAHPPPLHASPLLVQNKDVEFVIQDLSKGDSLGAYVTLRDQDSNFLCRARVHTQASGKQRMVCRLQHVFNVSNRLARIGSV
jgi:hypothetical protein